MIRRLAEGEGSEPIPLPSRLLIGRSASCALRLRAAVVSSEHASLSWNGRLWEIRDLGSSNGTFVDGRRLGRAGSAVLSPGSRVGFGDPDDLWELTDAGPPDLIAVDLGSSRIHAAIDGLLALPSEANPEVSIYRARTGRWVAERAQGEDAAHPLEDEEIVSAAGRAFRIQLPFVSEGTPMVEVRPRLSAISIRFAVSRNEERVEMTVLHRGEEIPLEPREHAYVLLTLARERQATRDLPAEERGWIERVRLLKMLRMDENGLNVAIHRARQQLLTAGVEDAAAIVEVRRSRRRLGIERFEIVPLVDPADQA